MNRPELNVAISLNDFLNHYWLRTELVFFCRNYGIIASGSKMEIADRIQLFLATGKKIGHKESKPVVDF